MLVVHHSSMTRSTRIVWLLEELDLPYEIASVPFEPPTPKPFAQKTPYGKFPCLEDDGVVMFESGAILEYVLERYGDGRLAPSPGSPERAAFLQWVHFAETAFTGLGNLAWHSRFREDTDQIPEAIADYRAWAEASLDTLERGLEGRDFILGDELSGADVMLGYTLLVAKAFGVLGDAHPRADAYLARLTSRPALQKALQAG